MIFLSKLAILFSFLRMILISRDLGFVFLIRAILAVVFSSRRIKLRNGVINFEDRLNPLSMGIYPLEIQRIARYSKAPLRALDIGANIGLWMIFFKRSFPDSTVFSIEPNRRPFDLLRKNILDNRVSNSVKAFNLCFGPSDTDLDFFFIDGKSGQGSFSPEIARHDLLGKDEISCIKVTQMRPTPEFFLKNCGGINFDIVKVDVEGAEDSVIKSLHFLTWKVLFVEINKSHGREIELVNFICETWPGAEIAERIEQTNTYEYIFSCEP